MICHSPAWWKYNEVCNGSTRSSRLTSQNSKNGWILEWRNLYNASIKIILYSIPYAMSAQRLWQFGVCRLTWFATQQSAIVMFYTYVLIVTIIS